MRCHFKRVIVGLLGVVCLASVFHLFVSEQLGLSVGDEFRQVDGRDYPESVAASPRVRLNSTEAVPDVRLGTSRAPTVGRRVIDDSLRKWLPDAHNTLANYFTMRNNLTVDDPQYNDSIFVYAHLNKAAGSTTKRCLSMVAAKTGRRILGPVLDSTGRGRMQTKLKNDKTRLGILMGGYAFGICDAAKDIKCSYFTILRDPYERLMSSYTYCRRAGMDQTCRALGPWDASLKEWAVHQGSYFFRQLLMKPWFCTTNARSSPNFNNLTGIPHARGTRFASAPCWFKEKVILKRSLAPADLDAILQYCVDHLEEWFSMIGITDEYDLSLAMLERVYRLPFEETCTGKKINTSDYKNLTEEKKVGNETERTDMVSQWKTELKQDSEVYEALKADIVLYEKALDIFARQKTAFLQNFQT